MRASTRKKTKGALFGVGGGLLRAKTLLATKGILVKIPVFPPPPAAPPRQLQELARATLRLVMYIGTYNTTLPRMPDFITKTTMAPNGAEGTTTQPMTANKGCSALRSHDNEAIGMAVNLGQ